MKRGGIAGALLHNRQEQRNSGAGGSFCTVLSGHDTFCSRLQLPNTREGKSTWVNRKQRAVSATADCGLVVQCKIKSVF